MIQLLTVSILYFFIGVQEINSDEMNIVHTANGALRGKLMTTDSGTKFRAFLGVPFAAPPTGSLRFMPPAPPLDWEGVRDATVEGKECVQIKPGGDEDCLYLNVYTAETTNQSSLPVMVYIHGGGFYGGSASFETYGPQYFMDNGIVLVTIQYRLGVFGFLSNEDSIIPGNQGLKDQRKALQWVQDNIVSFGGEPRNVTIFGNSAGSASVHLHMIASKSKHLFARAISQSGTALSAFAFIGNRTSRNITLLLAQHLECPTDSSMEISHCLQNKDPAIIQREYSKLQFSGYEIRKVLYRPIVEAESEHSFLTESPINATSEKPWLVGINQNEGLWKIHVPSLNKTKHSIQTDYKNFLPRILFFEDTCSNQSEIAEKIFNYYFKNSSSENETIVSLEQVISDSYFFWPTFQALAQHRGSAYCYLFNHQGEHSIVELFQAPQGFGVSHMDELLYLFPRTKSFPRKMNTEDNNISKLLIGLWVNFAKVGNPTPKAISKNPQSFGNEEITWEVSQNGNVEFLKIETNILSMVKNVFSQRMGFWKHLSTRDKLT